MVAKNYRTKYPTLTHENNALKIKKIENSGTTPFNPIYIGWAEPGSATSASAWQIVKCTYDGNDKLTDVQYAGGNIADTNVWDDRASYSYS